MIVTEVRSEHHNQRPTQTINMRRLVDIAFCCNVVFGAVFDWM